MIINNDIKKTIFEVEIKDFDISPLRIYFKEFLPKDLNELAGFINVHANKGELHTELKKCGIYFNDSVKNIVFPEKMDIITPHKLRSTFAMDYYSITQDVLSLQKILGHSNIQTTNIYAQSTENAIRDTRNVIERKRIYS